MRTVLVAALMVTGCKKSDDGDSDAPVPAEFGLDERPANPSCLATADRLQGVAEISLDRVWNSVDLNSPLSMSQAPGDPDHWYVIEQSGRVKRFDVTEASPVAEQVLDITGPVEAGGEMGLLGFAFHPDFASNGQVFLSYTAPGPVSKLVRIQTSNNGASWDAGSSTEIMSVNQPYSNHNGGDVAFGPDGMLYWGLGDGGSAGDPENRAQRLNNRLGKMLRVDVDGGTPYAIPPDNPFAGTEFREEIWAYGLRNPWRFSFDTATGELWVGDVGQNAIEEVSKVERGGNYGWRIKEGRACYATQPCDGNGLIDPVVQYQQNPGFSVMGGVVYRGQSVPDLIGTYLFADYYSGQIWGVTYDPATGNAGKRVLLDTNRSVVAFANALDGEVYILDHGNGGIYRIEPLSGGVEPDFPTTLSATGCVDASNPQAWAAPVVPFEVTHAFWSDGAEKRRGVAIPDGTTIAIEANGDLSFPVGSVLIKEFVVNGVLAETRLLMSHEDGDWAGYAYKWRADGSDADLLPSNEVIDANGQDWEIPSRPACMRCHTAVAGRVLGPELSQLDRDAVYPSTNRTAPQIATWDHIGWFASAPPDPEPYPALDDASASVDARARAYLHVNCTSCHQPEGPVQSLLDFRFTTPFADMGLCDPPLEGDLGIEGARVIAPGDPGRSVLLARLRDEGAYRMPPLGTDVVDTVGADVIESWISELSGCP